MRFHQRPVRCASSIFLLKVLSNQHSRAWYRRFSHPPDTKFSLHPVSTFQTRTFSKSHLKNTANNFPTDADCITSGEVGVGPWSSRPQTDVVSIGGNRQNLVPKQPSAHLPARHGSDHATVFVTVSQIAGATAARSAVDPLYRRQPRVIFLGPESDAAGVARAI